MPKPDRWIWRPSLEAPYNNVMIWNKVYVEDEPMFAELQGFKAVKAVAGTRKPNRTGSRK